MVPISRIAAILLLVQELVLQVVLGSDGNDLNVKKYIVSLKPTNQTFSTQESDPLKATQLNATKFVQEIGLAYLGPNSASIQSEGGSAGNSVEKILQSASYGGFIANLDGQTAKNLSDNANVESVVEDSVIMLSEPIVCNQLPPSNNTTEETWGLARISNRATYSNGQSINPPANFGEGVTIYTIDTGIRTTHKEFGGRASCPVSFVNGTDCVDDQGHGTHVAGIAAGDTYGVARKARIVAIKVADKNGAGTLGWIVEGMIWIANNHDPSGRSVVNISMGGQAHAKYRNYLRILLDFGISIVGASGNEGDHRCLSYPGNDRSIITVGAINPNDSRAPFSNFGPCLDLYAPGVCIKSAYNTTDDAYAVLSGTSMATPYVTGVSAIYLSLSAGSPQQLSDRLKQYATKDKVQNSGQDANNNYIVYNQEKA